MYNPGHHKAVPGLCCCFGLRIFNPIPDSYHLIDSYSSISTPHLAMIIPLTVLSLLSCIMADPQAVSVAGKGGMPRVLVYTRTLGYRHDSIPTAIDMLKTQSGTYGVNFEFTE